MSKLRIALLSLAIVFTFGFQNQKKPRLGELRGEISKDFARSVSHSPGALFHLFVHEDYVPMIDFEKGLKNVVDMVEKAAIRIAMSPFDPCEPVFEGKNDDKDEDRIPLNGTFHLNCQTGPEKLIGAYEISDQNDALRPPQSGYEIHLKTARGQVFNQLKHKVAFEVDTSEHIFNVQKNKSDSSGSAEGKASIAETGAQLVVGFEGTADYSGDIANRKTGDKVRGNGIVKFEGTKLTGFPDAAFVAKVRAEGTFGVCPGSQEPAVRTGEGVLEDSKGNKIKFTVTDCVGTVTYNGEAIKIDAKDSIPLPGKNLDLVP